jgi:hypothetical protein
MMGGNDASYLNSAEVFEPASGKFMTVSGGMTVGREELAAVLLSTGRVPVTGSRSGDYLSAVDRRDFAAGAFACHTGLSSSSLSAAGSVTGAEQTLSLQT